jgi:uncharacterized protein (TIGR03437 family)
MRLGFLLTIATGLSAQLIPSGTPIPRRTTLPVVFLNGYQIGCIDSAFASNFGMADQVLAVSQIASVYFDNCSVPNNPSIEALGVAFGQYLSALRYDDGSTVPQVDIVAHSLGGLIVRSYLAGKQDVSPAAFTPPANPAIRKAIFIATPHFGTPVAADLGLGRQVSESTSGSTFLFDLNTWNQGTDDLRGVDALAIIGNAGTGNASGTAGFDDGLASLTSASIGFARPGRTRIVPFCHGSSNLFLVFNLCSSAAMPIANIPAGSNVVGQIMASFLTGTNDWQNLGQATDQNNLASMNAGVNLIARTMDDQTQSIGSVNYSTTSGSGSLAKNDNNIVAFKEALPASASISFTASFASGSNVSTTSTLPAATTLPVVAKQGPFITRALPSAANIFPLSVAPGSFVTIYGSNLSSTSEQALPPYPTKIGDVEVQVNGLDVPLQYASPNQINLVFADLAPGLAKLTVRNSGGVNTVNVLVDPAVPAIFSVDGSGTGPAAAVNPSTGKLVSANAPLRAGDYVSLYLTGLGSTTRQNGFDYAQIQPTVAIGGQNCNVTYAGRSGQYAALDQINCLLPNGITTGPSVPVNIQSSGRSSNIATLAVQ